MQSHKNAKLTAPARAELNQIVLSGQIMSRVQVYASGKLVFTLKNESGRFFVQWVSPNWKPDQDSHVLVRGSLFSALCKCKRGHTARIQADEIILLHSDQEQQ